MPAGQGHLHRILHGGLFQERQQQGAPGPTGAGIAGQRVRCAVHPASPRLNHVRGRKTAVRVVITVHRHAQLLQVIHTWRPPRTLPRRLDRGQQQCHQDADDRDHHQ